MRPFQLVFGTMTKRSKVHIYLWLRERNTVIVHNLSSRCISDFPLEHGAATSGPYNFTMIESNELQLKKHHLAYSMTDETPTLSTRIDPADGPGEQSPALHSVPSLQMIDDFIKETAQTLSSAH